MERRVRSDTEAIPFRIDTAGRANFHLDIAVTHRIVGAHDLPVTLRSVCEQAEPEPMGKRRREGDRRDISLIVGCARFRAFGDEMRSGAEPILAVDRPEAYERRTGGISQRGP